MEGIHGRLADARVENSAQHKHIRIARRVAKGGDFGVRASIRVLRGPRRADVNDEMLIQARGSIKLNAKRAIDFEPDYDLLCK
jgi:hypothetical protein